MLIKWDLASIDMLGKQDFFTNFLKGGGFREMPATRKRSDSAAHELKGYSVTFHQVIDLDNPT